ncbi:hypothetical protein Ancab_034183 [Ancistrocladus abbreviatus]
MAKRISTSSNSSWIIGLLTMVMVILLMAKKASAITCQEAISILAPCSGYLKGKDPAPPSGACCSSCHSLQQSCHTKEERKAVCLCLKATGPKIGVFPERAKQLTGYCKLPLSVPITPDIDCEK